jgi:hypothetical protein
MLLREAADSATRPSGLLGMSISHQVVAGCAELVSVSIWQDMDTMVSVIGPRWREPAWLPGLEEAGTESKIELLEAVVTSFEDLGSTARVFRADAD